MIQMNPVLSREVRERMRTGRAFAVVGGFLGVLLLTVFLVYQGNVSSGDISFDLSQQTRLGRQLFDFVLTVMTSLVLFFVPGLTAGAIAGERERQTLLPLQVTLLRPRSIVIGKVLAGSSFVLLLIVASLPVLAICYLLGGVNLTDSLRGVTAVLFVAITLTTMIAAISSVIRRVQTATLASYAFTALVVLIAPVTYLIMSIADASSGTDRINPPAVVLTANPYSVVADATASRNVDDGDAPLGALAVALFEAKEQTNDRWFTWFPQDSFDDRFDDQFNDIGLVGARERSGVPAWFIGGLTLVVWSALMAWFGISRLRTPAEMER
jgi:ABC-2 type transport system permease protein